MIPLPPAELTVVRIPIADKRSFRLRIDSVLESLPIIKEIQPGCQVLIKPSAILLNHAARESHQLLLAVLVEAIQEIGGLVSIGDSPGYMEASTIHYWRASGLAELAERSGCTLFNFEEAETKVVMVDSRVYYLPVALQEFDLIINAACLGLDSNRNVAGVISNCLGFLPGRQISAWNEDDAAVDLFAVVSPHLNLLQFECHGELYIVFGEDGVAIDTTVISRLSRAGLPRQVRLASEAGLGLAYAELVRDNAASLPQSVDTELIALDSGRSRLAVLEHLRPNNVLRPMRMIDTDKCDGCDRCYEVCPTGSIAMTESHTPVWNKSLCVECWRCREHCHSNAIAVLSTGSAP